MMCKHLSTNLPQNILYIKISRRLFMSPVLDRISAKLCAACLCVACHDINSVYIIIFHPSADPL